MNKTVRNQILQLERAQVRAINRGDVRAALKMFDPSLIGFSSTRHERIRGLAALARTFQHYLKLAPRMTYTIAKTQVHLKGPVAFATFYWTVGLGKGRKIHGRGSHVFARKGKNWRVIHEHFSRAH